MKKLFFILIFGAYCIFLSSPAHALTARQQCQKVMTPPKLTVHVSYGKLTYNHDLGHRALARLHARQYGKNIGPNTQLQGLATSQYAYKTAFTAVKHELNNGVFCVYPQDVHLYLSIDDPVIYVAKELQVGSCQYELALRHEQTHQQITLEVFEHYLPLIQQRFIETIKQNGLLSGKGKINTTYASETIKDRLTNVMTPLFDELQKTNLSEQIKLDNPQNYNFEQSLCR